MGTMRQVLPKLPDYVIEGPLSGFVKDEGTFTTESEREFQDWLNDHLLGEELFFVKDKEIVELQQAAPVPSSRNRAPKKNSGSRVSRAAMASMRH
jgi:hypothetical protein